MAFKINKQTRIKMCVGSLHDLRRAADIQCFHTFLWNFEKEAGIKSTCQRYTKTHSTLLYYFKIIDVNKYLLAKLKYAL